MISLCLYFVVTLDGSFGYVVPVAEKVFKRLQDMYSELVSRLDHVAGLNPKAFRYELCCHLAISTHQCNAIGLLF
jgi:hypothetical protein